MFKKLHRQMTIFASLITSGILILMAVSCLVISERGLTHNTYERFLNNGNSCVAYLENQTVLSHKWILEAKQEYKVEFRIRNNGKKLYFDKLDTESRNQDKKEDDLSSVENMLTEAARISREEQGLDVDYMGSLSLSKTVYFETSDFYACTALIPKGSGVLSLVLVYPWVENTDLSSKSLVWRYGAACSSGFGYIFLVFYRKNASPSGRESKETNPVYCFGIP